MKINSRKFFSDFLKDITLVIEGTQEKTAQVKFENNKAVVKEETGVYGQWNNSNIYNEI